MAQRKKREWSAQQKVKASQNARKRRRQHGGEHSGAFASGASSAGAGHHVGRNGAPFRRPGGPMMNPSDPKEHFTNVSGSLHAGQFSETEIARHITRSQRMPDLPGRAQVLTRGDMDVAPVRVTSSQTLESGKLRAEGSWKTNPDLYTQEGADKGRYVPASTFIEKNLAPSHKKWLKDQLNDPDSEFSKGLRKDNSGRVVNKTKGAYSPGQRNRLQIYTNALQEGVSHPEAMARLRGERRGRSSSVARASSPRTGGQTRLERVGQTPDSIGIDARQRGRSSRYQSVAPSHNEFRIGIASSTADSLSQLRRKMPERSEKELIQIQQFQRMYLADELDKNNRWAHETKRANIMGNKGGKETSSDRVVFFTTNLGYPAPSVPSDSLVGQYIIRKRKAFLRDENSVSEKDLKGKFPEAVRDQHIIEASTGLSFGAEGRWGAFQKSGWRRGAKKSRNFGKPVPVGSQVIYDSQGRPMYDSQGNIRFSEGATRPFKFESMKDAGVRVFIG